MTYRHFWVPAGSQLKNSYQFLLMTSRNRSSLEDGFRLLVSSNPLLRFWLVVSRDLANLGKSSSWNLPCSVCHPPGFWPFSVSHLLGLGWFFNWLFGDWKTPVSHFDKTKPSKKSLSRCNVLCSSHETLTIKIKTKLARPSVYYNGSSEHSHAPKFEWPDHRVHRVATAAFWRTFSDEGKIHR